jgi:hypothetical protein
MRGSIKRSSSYAGPSLTLAVEVNFDAVQFNKAKKFSDPLAFAMPQIKNVVLDAVGVRGMPSYARQSYSQAYPRAKKGIITLTLNFDISDYAAQALGANPKSFFLHHFVDLNTTLEATRDQGHLFAKSVIASYVSN